MCVVLSATVGACAQKGPGCDALALKLCDQDAEHCAAARGWIDAQGAGDAAARDEACSQMVADPQALAAYVSRFTTAMAGSPGAPEAARPASAATPPRAKPTTQDQIRTFGDNVEEIGKTGEKAGEAIDKIGGAFGGKKDTTP